MYIVSHEWPVKTKERAVLLPWPWPCELQKLVNISLAPRPPLFFVLQFAFSIIHGSGSSSTSVYYTEWKPKNKEWWRRLCEYTSNCK